MAAKGQPGKSTKMVWRTCLKCTTRLSELCYDKHTLCETCRAKVCDFNSFCEECESWTQDFRTLYMRHQRELYLKRVSKENAKSPPVVDDAASAASLESHVCLPMVMLPLDPHLVDSEVDIAELGNLQTVDSVIEIQSQPKSPPPPARHVPMSLKEAVAVERSLRSSLESHNFLTWSVVALIRSLHEKKLLPMDDPVISQLQKSFSKACGNVASCLTSDAPFVTLKRRQLLLSHVVPSVSDAQKRSLLSDPFFQTSSLFSASSVEAARSAARDLSLFKPHLKASSSTNQPRRPTYSSSSAQRGSARHSSRPSSSQRTSSPYRQQSGRKGDSRFQKKSSGTPPETRGFSEVGALSLSGGRRLPSQLLVGLEGSGGGRLGSGGSAGWLLDPLRPSASSI